LVDECEWLEIDLQLVKHFFIIKPSILHGAFMGTASLVNTSVGRLLLSDLGNWPGPGPSIDNLPNQVYFYFYFYKKFNLVKNLPA